MGLATFARDNARFLAAGALLTFCSGFGQTYLISVFAGRFMEDFGLTHGQWGLTYLAGTLASGVVMVWVGVLTDHFRARALGAAALAALAACCLCMALAPGAWALPLVVFALRLAGQGMMSHIAVVAMSRWFVASRGRALTVAYLGYAVGEALMPLFIVLLFDFLHWRAIWAGFAVFLLLAIPVLVRLLRLERTPASVAGEAQAAGMLARHWTRGQALRHWLFWIMVPTVLGPSAWLTALFFQQVHLAGTKGWTHASLVALFPLYTGAAILATIVSGLLVDRFGSGRLVAFIGLPMAAGFAVIGQAGSLAGFAAGLVFVACGHGCVATVPNAFWAEFYGTRHIGGIKSMATAVMVLGSALGPGVTGGLIDLGIAFEDQMLGISAFFLAASAALLPAAARARTLLRTA